MSAGCGNHVAVPGKTLPGFDSVEAVILRGKDLLALYQQAFTELVGKVRRWLWSRVPRPLGVCVGELTLRSLREIGYVRW